MSIIKQGCYNVHRAIDVIWNDEDGLNAVSDALNTNVIDHSFKSDLPYTRILALRFMLILWLT